MGVVRASPDENPNLVLAMHMDSQECQRDVSPVTCARRQGHREVVGTLVCFPWSVHKLLGHSNEKAQKRLEAMSTGPYGIRDLKAVLEGTGLKMVWQKLQDPILPESLLPGSYVFGQKGHMVGVHIREDHSVEVYDNCRPGGVGRFSPKSYYCAWKVEPLLMHCFPWSVHRLLGDSNEDAQRRLEAMSSGPHEVRHIRAALEGTGVKLVRQKLQDPLLPESLSPGNYIFGQAGHVIGVCVREDHSLDVHDNKSATGIGHFSPADYSCAWKLASD